MTLEDKKLLLAVGVGIVVSCLLLFAIFSFVFSSLRGPGGLYYNLEGYLEYDQDLDVDKIAQELRNNNITVDDVDDGILQWESIGPFGETVQGYDDFSVVHFQYKISINSSTYPLPVESIYKEDNGSIEINIYGTVKNSIYDSGFEESHESHWAVLYIENAGTDETEVSEWKPVMEKELYKIKQIILEATNLTFTEEIVSVLAANWD
jgi:hypothetical protein